MVSDVWSIGAMVYRLVGDRDPFLRDDRRDDPKALRRLEAGDCDWGRIATMSRPGKAFVFKCLRPHPGLRWAAARGVALLRHAASDASPRLQHPYAVDACVPHASPTGGPRPCGRSTSTRTSPRRRRSGTRARGSPRSSSPR